VAVKIKLKRMGKIRQPQYRIVVADSRTKRDGRAIEEIGLYHPKEDPSLIRVDSERVQHWLSVGAQPTEPVLAILKVTGDWQRHKGLPGAEGTLRTREPKADKLDSFNTALARAHGSPPPEQPARAARGSQAAAHSTAAAAAPAEPAPAEPAPAEPAPADSGAGSSAQPGAGSPAQPEA
jgi:small subunit ribosomal protein S16